MKQIIVTMIGVFVLMFPAIAIGAFEDGGGEAYFRSWHYPSQPYYAGHWDCLWPSTGYVVHGC